MNQYTQDYGTQRAELVNAFMRGIYGWMCAGLSLTAVIAWLTLNTPAIQQIIYSTDASGATVGLSMTYWVMMIAEFGIVMYLSARIAKMAPGTATMLFMVYSGMNGLTIAPILALYTAASVAQVFFITAGMFGSMSLYGLITKKDLTSMGSFMMMGLFGIIIASIVNIFMQSSMMSLVISAVGVIVFLGLTAWDTQKFKTMGENMPNDAATVRRGAIMGALTLYLDFINLFLMLLRLLGSRD